MIRLTALALCTALAAGPAAALDLGAMTDAERQAFRAEVRAYLLENPEVLREAIAALEQREREEQAISDLLLVRDNMAALTEDPNSWVGGNPDGDITVVEFLDYRCGFCRRAHPEVTELIETDGNIRLIVKEFPILGEASELSSRFAIATLKTAGPEAYKAAHDALIALRSDVTPQVLEELANTLGLDPGTILPLMASEEVTAIILENRALGQRLGINGTPTFVMQDQLVRGYVPLDEMREIVDELRREG